MLRRSCSACARRICSTSLSVAERLPLESALLIVPICVSSLEICPLKFAIFWFAKADVRSTTMRASAFAAQAVTRRFADFTLIDTSAVWPFLAMFPATACVEMPPLSCAGLVLHAAATCAITLWACTIVFTVLGFVCRFCSCTLPLAEYGWPR